TSSSPSVGPQISVYSGIPDRQTVQVIQQALHRQPSTAAQYLQQMYAAQQQHLMLQTAALQQQHLSSAQLQSLAAVQQASLVANRQGSSSGSSVSTQAPAQSSSINLAASPAAAQLINRAQSVNSATASGIAQQAVLLGNTSSPALTASQAQMYLRAQMLIFTPTATVATVQPELGTGSPARPPTPAQNPLFQVQNLTLRTQQTPAAGASGPTPTQPVLPSLALKPTPGGSQPLPTPSQGRNSAQGSPAGAKPGVMDSVVEPLNLCPASLFRIPPPVAVKLIPTHGDPTPLQSSHVLFLWSSYAQLQPHQLLSQPPSKHLQPQFTQQSRPALQPQSQPQLASVPPSLALQPSSETHAMPLGPVTPTLPLQCPTANLHKPGSSQQCHPPTPDVGSHNGHPEGLSHIPQRRFQHTSAVILQLQPASPVQHSAPVTGAAGARPGRAALSPQRLQPSSARRARAIPAAARVPAPALRPCPSLVPPPPFHSPQSKEETPAPLSPDPVMILLAMGPLSHCLYASQSVQVDFKVLPAIQCYLISRQIWSCTQKDEIRMLRIQEACLLSNPLNPDSTSEMPQWDPPVTAVSAPLGEPKTTTLSLPQPCLPYLLFPELGGKQTPYLPSPQPCGASLPLPLEVIMSLQVPAASIRASKASLAMSFMTNGENKPPQAIVKPQILTHVIEGFVIQEGAEPFPVGRSSLLVGNLKKKYAQGFLPEKLPQQDHTTTTDSEMEEPYLQESKEEGTPLKLKCELCGRVDFAYKFKRSKRFCSMACAKRYNVGCTKRVGLFHSDRSKLQKAGATTHNRRRASKPTGTVPLSVTAALQLTHSQEDSSRCSDNSSYEEPLSPISASSSTSRRRQGQRDLELPDMHMRDLVGMGHHFLPSEPTKWNVEDVYEFIRSLPGCQEIAEEFRAQEIDGQALLLLKEDHLMSAMNIKLGPALKIYARISMLKDS
uniref:Polyhomeotic homolog 2 n=1 Tax=Loxodonta africana TaxID=9785 RepID=G3TVJ3_LOXAF